MAEYYNEPRDYIENATSLKDKVKRIDQIIESLLLSSSNTTGTGNVEEYHYNDGQTIVKAIYRSSSEMMNSVKGWISIRNLYDMRLSGRVKQLRDFHVNKLR